VERLVRGYRRAQEAEELSREAQQHAKRSVHYGFDDDGSLVLKARLPALAGAMLIKALDAALESLPDQEISADDVETLDERGAGRCEIEHGPSIPVETVRRLSCDASLLHVLENEQGEVLDVGRKTRSIPAPIRRALNSRDSGCRFPGCTHQRYLDAHHIEHWAEGGETKLSNLLTLCRLHHRLVHEGKISIETLSGGRWRFLHPDGRAFDLIDSAQPVSYGWGDLEQTHAGLGIRIDSGTAATRWRGERMDYDLGVSVLCQQAARARGDDDVSAETSEALIDG
jgi:hypothetical protein